ncbi:MAG: aminotransferase class IV [Bacteroidota bacterium]
MLDQVYIDGQFCHRNRARIPLNDLGVLRAYGVFDYFRYVDGKLQFFADHWLRFQRSAAQLDLQIGISQVEAEAMIRELIDRNGADHGGIRLLLTGGSAMDGYTPVTPRFMSMAFDHRQPPAHMYERGVSVLVHPYERQSPTIKSIDYMEGIRLLGRMRAQGYDFPLYLDRFDNLRESDRSNFMIVQDGVLITPIDDVLPGITRQHTLRLAVQLGIPIEERTVSLQEFDQADEAMLTSSTKGVMPICKSDRGLVSNGKPGELTKRLMLHWSDYATTFQD